MLIRLGGGAVPSNFTTPLTEEPSAGEGAALLAKGLVSRIKLRIYVALSANIGYGHFIVSPLVVQDISSSSMQASNGERTQCYSRGAFGRSARGPRSGQASERR